MEDPKTKREPKPGVCRICSCTETEPCTPPCAWADETWTLCSNCAEMIALIAEWGFSSPRPSFSLVARAAKEAYEKAPVPYRLVIPSPEEVRAIAGGAH